MLSFAVNYLAVILAAIVGMFVGYIWYSKALFGALWMKSLGLKSMGRKQDMTKTMVAAFVSTFMTAFILSVLIKSIGAVSMTDGIVVALVAWLGFYVTFNIVRTAFQRTSLAFFLEEIGYELVVLVLMSMVIVLLP